MDDPKVVAQVELMQEMCNKMFSELVTMTQQRLVLNSPSSSASIVSESSNGPESFEMICNPETTLLNEKNVAIETISKETIIEKIDESTSNQEDEKKDATAKIEETNNTLDVGQEQNEAFNEEVFNEENIKDDDSAPEMNQEQIRQKCLKLFEDSVQKEPVSVVLNTLGEFMENCTEVFSDCEDDDDGDNEPTPSSDTHLRIGKLLTEMSAWAKELEKKV